jgi:hypothetical protein
MTRVIRTTSIDIATEELGDIVEAHLAKLAGCQTFEGYNRTEFLYLKECRGVRITFTKLESDG